VQLDRVRKHWLVCQRGYDEVALLDLAHSLRVIAEASDEVSKLIASRGIKGLPHSSIGPQLKKLIGKSDFWAILLSGWFKTGSIKASTVLKIMRLLSLDEIARMSVLLQPHTAGDTLDPAHWFGAEVVIARRTTPLGPERAGLSRTMAIKRVANTLGGSHIGNDGSDNRFDWVVEWLLSTRIGDIPAPYCILMNIAQDILTALDPDLRATSGCGSRRRSGR